MASAQSCRIEDSEQHGLQLKKMALIAGDVREDSWLLHWYFNIYHTNAVRTGVSGKSAEDLVSKRIRVCWWHLISIVWIVLSL